MALSSSSNKQTIGYCPGRVFLGRGCRALGKFAEVRCRTAGSSGDGRRGLAVSRRSIGQAGGASASSVSMQGIQALSAVGDRTVAPDRSHRLPASAEIRAFGVPRRLIASFATAAGSVDQGGQLGGPGAATGGGASPLSRSARAPYARRASQSRKLENSLARPAPAARGCGSLHPPKNREYRNSAAGSGVRGIDPCANTLADSREGAENCGFDIGKGVRGDDRASLDNGSGIATLSAGRS